jgi:hypothetical protein
MVFVFLQLLLFHLILLENYNFFHQYLYGYSFLQQSQAYLFLIDKLGLEV